MNELLDRVHAYLDGRDSLGDFESWFYGLASDIHKQGPDSEAQMVYAIEGILAESSSAKWPEATLRAELESVLSPYKSHAA
jgi:hypothetical protein